MFARDTALYAAVVGLAIFFVGWSTGMGGSFLPNLVFSAAMALLAAVCFTAVKRIGARRRERDHD